MAPPKVTRFCSIIGCDGAHVSRGYCSRHYQRLKNHGDPLIVVRKRSDNGTPLAERLWSHVDRGGADECWPFTASLGSTGYGRLTVDGRLTKAHRIAYELVHGPIPDGGCVLHACDNPPCCNPAHLRVGTQAENTADKLERDRQPRGIRHWGAKLNDEKVREMRRLRDEGLTFKAIGRRFRVHHVTARHACLGITWGHVA